MLRSPTLALFNRSLREDTRKATPYFMRMALASLILVFLMLAHSSFAFSMKTTAGLEFFTVVIWINVVFFTVVGLAHFASAITEEKEEMTLGLLRMTNLNPLSILLGKSTNRLFLALLYLAAQFPFTLLAVTLGGVSTGQIVAAYAALAAYIILLANLALFFSVLCRRTYTAAFLSFISLLATSLGILLAYMIAKAFGVPSLSNPDGFAYRLAECTIAARLSEVLTTGFTGGPISIQVISNIAGGGVLFLLSWAIFNQFTQKQLGTDAGPARALTTAKTVRGKKRPLAPGRPGKLALFWKDHHFIHSGAVGLLTRTLLLGGLFFLLIPGIVVIFAYWIPEKPFDFHDLLDNFDGYGGVVFSASLALLQLQLALLASRIFREEIRWKTLSSLAMLPTSMRAIAYQKVAAVFVAAIPVVGFIFLGLILNWEETIDIFIGVFDDISFEVIFGTFSVFIYLSGQLLLLLHFIAWLSIHLKWGAFALGLFGMFIANMLYTTIFAFVAPAGPFGSFFLGGIGAIVLTFILHAAIGHGLKTVAARE